MGISHVETWALLDAIKAGVSFRRTATIGRQNLHTGPSQLCPLLTAAGVQPQKQSDFFSGRPIWADELFRLLGADEVVSFDASNYEGATVVHDFNQPIPREYQGSFDFVYDGGTLEHIFHVPNALRNQMEMTNIGGHLLIAVPANNTLGHGFYQFSPEFFYRVLSPENGFEVIRMTLTSWLTGERFLALDPAVVGRRVEFYATEPSLMMCALARRTALKPIFARPPYQSDYTRRWSGSCVHGFSPPSSGLRSWLRRMGERFFPRVLNYVRQKRSQRLSYHPDLFPPLPRETCLKNISPPSMHRPSHAKN